jgi:hypothetical protein
LDEGGPAAKRHAFEYPKSEMLRLEAIGETVPVYRGRIQIMREITFGQDGVLKPLVTSTGEVILKGSFHYQACDDRKCYLPEDVPLEWRFNTKVWTVSAPQRSSSASRTDLEDLCPKLCIVPKCESSV